MSETTDAEFYAAFRRDNPELRPSEADWPVAYDVHTDEFRAATQRDMKIFSLMNRQMGQIVDLWNKQKSERMALAQGKSFPEAERPVKRTRFVDCSVLSTLGYPAYDTAQAILRDNGWIYIIGKDRWELRDAIQWQAFVDLAEKIKGLQKDG